MLLSESINPPGVAPGNFLPAALPELIGNPQEGQLTAIYYDTKGIVLRTLSRSLLETFENRDEAKKALTGLVEERGITLGPRVNSQNKRIVEIATTARNAEPAGTGKPTEIGIIDAGIAFWNPLLGDRFETITGLSFRNEPTDDGAQAISIDQLEPDTIEQMYARGNSREGDLQNQAIMKEKLPSSVFASRVNGPALFGGNRASHGTMMAELVIETAHPDIRLHGFELPESVLRDLTGGQLRGILDAAVRGLALSAANASPNNGNFRLVILLAYGILGGPQGNATFPPEILKTLNDTKNELSQRNNIDLEFVFPIGNHRQDRCFAQLPPNKDLYWHTMPDDHSSNTLEIIHSVEFEGFLITAPDGSSQQIKLPQNRHLEILFFNGSKIGAIWSEFSSTNSALIRTRISLAPTASRDLRDKRAPHGRWTLRHTSDSTEPVLDIWVLRDETGFEQEVAQMFRPSWLDDGIYQKSNEYGLPLMNDPTSQDLLVKRAGTSSLLSSVTEFEGVHVVGSKHRNSHNGNFQEAPYSSLGLTDHPNKHLVDIASGTNVVATYGPFGKRAVLGDGTARRFWSSGTSLSAAIYAGGLAKTSDNAST